MFENLPGAGKPLDLEEYFNTPEDLRMAFSILKNANCAPPEVEMMKEVSSLEHAIAEASDAATRKPLQRILDIPPDSARHRARAPVAAQEITHQARRW